MVEETLYVFKGTWFSGVKKIYARNERGTDEFTHDNLDGLVNDDVFFKKLINGDYDIMCRKPDSLPDISSRTLYEDLTRREIRSFHRKISNKHHVRVRE